MLIKRKVTITVEEELMDLLDKLEQSGEINLMINNLLNEQSNKDNSMSEILKGLGRIESMLNSSPQSVISSTTTSTSSQSISWDDCLNSMTEDTVDEDEDDDDWDLDNIEIV